MSRRSLIHHVLISSLQSDWRTAKLKSFEKLPAHMYHIFETPSDLYTIPVEHLKRLAILPANVTYNLTHEMKDNPSGEYIPSHGIHQYRNEGCFPPYLAPGTER